MRFQRILLLVVLALPSFAYLIHGGNQAGILDGLLLNGEAWNDDSNSLAFMIVGAAGLIVAVVLLVLSHVQQLRHEIEEVARAQRTT